MVTGDPNCTNIKFTARSKEFTDKRSDSFIKFSNLTMTLISLQVMKKSSRILIASINHVSFFIAEVVCTNGNETIEIWWKKRGELVCNQFSNRKQSPYLKIKLAF